MAECFIDLPAFILVFSLVLISETGCKNMAFGAEEMAQQLRSLAALLEHLALIPSRPFVTLKCLEL